MISWEQFVMTLNNEDLINLRDATIKAVNVRGLWSMTPAEKEMKPIERLKAIRTRLGVSLTTAKRLAEANS